MCKQTFLILATFLTLFFGVAVSHAQTPETTPTASPTPTPNPVFPFSTDPHSGSFPVTIGRRNKQSPAPQINKPADVTALELDKTEVVSGCPEGLKPSEKTCEAKTFVDVQVKAIDPEDDVLVYNYTVSAGKIEGVGENVKWNLSDVKPGTYTITVGADDGCGVCGKTMRKEIVVISAAAQSFKPRLISVNLDKTTATIHVDPRYMTTTCTEAEENIKVAVITENVRTADRLRYAVTGGRIIGEGSNVVWNFANTRPGKYSLTVELERDDKIIERSVPSVVELKECEWDPPPCECPLVTVSAPAKEMAPGDSIVFDAHSNGGSGCLPAYHWTVAGGTITSGQGTSKITVATASDAKGEVKATVELNGCCGSECQPQGSETVAFRKK